MLNLNRTTLLIGHILGLAVTTSLLASCGGSDSSSSSTQATGAVGTPVQVFVTATDPDGDQLHYRWAATDGTINNLDAAKTTWVVPPGSGLQFAYVVVSDNKGGYTERRAAALTFDPPAATPAANIAPSSPVGSPGFAWGSVFYKPSAFGRNVYLPGVTVTLSNGRSAVTDMKGQFFISDLPDGTYSATYQISGRPAVPFSNSIVVNSATPATSPSSGNYFSGQVSLSDSLNVAGSVRLQDGSYCGIRDEFFTRSGDPNSFSGPVSGTAQLIDTTATGNSLSSPFPINHYGDFLIVRSAVPPGFESKVRITCEQAVVTDPTTLALPASGAFKLPTSPTISNSTITLPNSRPEIGPMRVLLNGQDVGRPDLPPATTLLPEMELTPGDDSFLTYKGLDTRKSACAYYRAIGAVQGCDADGFPTGAQLTLDQWRRTFNLSPFTNGTPENPPAPDGEEVRIQYINKNDLNFGRDMQAVKLTNGEIAYNTCNYPGPQDVNDPLGTPKKIGSETPADFDLAIDNARRGIGMVVCVAMDYSPKSGITKFYTFGPTGNLLLSVSLDGRREKFMPGSCTACHGGAAYGGRFPDDRSGQPDLKSHWQPFDITNLAFRSNQDPAIANAAMKTLNQRMVGPNLDPMTTPRTRELISGWYAGGRLDQNSKFMPSQTRTFTEAQYEKIIQPGCQTCHAAQGTSVRSLNENLTDTTKICGGFSVLEQNHTMANSLVPFERFWLDPPPTSILNLGCASTPRSHPPL
jgi:mono/diheme cytochrome c family protein